MMSKKKLFDDDSDEEVALKTENEYAKKYDAWREKEEIHKLEQKYGSKPPDPDALSSDSEDDSDEPPEESEEMETQFLKTLALLKTKDPRIYDPNYKFFDEKQETSKDKKSVNEEKKTTLTFADSDDDDDDDDPNIFTIEKKAEVDKEEPDTEGKTSNKTAKEGKLKDFLTGKAEHIEDEVEKDLEPLKAFWSDPKLNEGEAFLRDYILNKRYMEEEEEGDGEAERLRDDLTLEADEALVQEQGDFERAYNFRFEEPDDEYLKRYPRTMNSIRPKDERRARRRAETRARKEQEKERKMEEIARLKALKLKEVREKIARIKHVTGNDRLAFKDEDIEGDFDPEEHDRRMRAIFDEAYYEQADEGKPVFPDLDEELEIENWDKYDTEGLREETAGDEEAAPHCEDDDFNMDADYEPSAARASLLERVSRAAGRRKRKRKTKLGQLLASAPPTYLPAADGEGYSRFMDEYYKMDCEDVIGGDLPTRFKYRSVVPNDYGLSVEEILLADDKELTQWVPLKKIVKHRPPNVEKSEVYTYRQKAADVNLKRKMLPSLFKDLPEEPEIVVPVENGKKKKRKKKKKDKEQCEASGSLEESEHTANVVEEVLDVDEAPTKKNKKKRKIKDTEESSSEVQNYNNDEKEELNTSENDLNCNDNNTETVKERKKKSKINNTEDSVKILENDTVKPAGKRKKKDSGSFVVEAVGNIGPSQSADVGSTNDATKLSKKRLNSEGSVNNSDTNGIPKKKKKKKHNQAENNHLSNAKDNDKKNNTQNKNFNTNKKDSFKAKFKSKDKNKQGLDKPTHPFSNLSDERLKAYGLNPKKYKNFLKYKKF